MSELILHHYPRSPYAQKIRSILGAKNVSWRSVIIPDIMPKPDVVALTGGYRRTPILQIGADIYCDTSLIAQVIDRRAPEPPLFPAQHKFVAEALANWADSVVFPLAVALAFQPQVLAKTFDGTPEHLAKFVADRTALRKNGNPRRVSLPEAQAMFPNYLADLDTHLADGREFLLGAAPTIADFALFHPLWFVRRGHEELFRDHTRVLGWFSRIVSFGDGNPSDLDSGEAIAIARQAQSEVEDASSNLSDFALGSRVQIAPTDYGIDPVIGELVLCDNTEMALRRHDERAGDVVVHFPRQGYLIRQAD